MSIVVLNWPVAPATLPVQNTSNSVPNMRFCGVNPAYFKSWTHNSPLLFHGVCNLLSLVSVPLIVPPVSLKFSEMVACNFQCLVLYRTVYPSSRTCFSGNKVVSVLTFLLDTGVPWRCWGSANLSLGHQFVLAFLHISISARMKQWAYTFLHMLIIALLRSVLTHLPCALFYHRLAASPACLDEALFC